MCRSRRRSGLSLLEIVAAVALLGVVAAVALPRLAGAGRDVRADACDRNLELIDLHAALHRRNTGDWPAADLSDLTTAAFPEGPPVCPVDGAAYTFDRSAGRAVPHGH